MNTDGEVLATFTDDFGDRIGAVTEPEGIAIMITTDGQESHAVCLSEAQAETFCLELLAGMKERKAKT